MNGYLSVDEMEMLAHHKWRPGPAISKWRWIYLLILYFSGRLIAKLLRLAIGRTATVKLLNWIFNGMID